jgi:hypothetical protein
LRGVLLGAASRQQDREAANGQQGQLVQENFLS